MNRDDMHTCHAECQRPACMAVREACAQIVKDEPPSKQKLIMQKATERALHALELRKTGLTYKAVGMAMNVSAVRARDLATKGERILKRMNT